MNRGDSRHEFETRLLTRHALLLVGFVVHVADPLSCSHELTAMIEQVASCCVTVRPGGV